MGRDGHVLALEPVVKQEGRESREAVQELGSHQLALSPSLQLDRVQVFQELGSLHDALERPRPAAYEDSLWRDNRRLRGEVQAWKDEAAARHRETAELRLEVAQLQAELQAERSRSQELLVQLEVLVGRRDLAIEGCPSSSSSRFRAEGLVDWRAKRPFGSAWETTSAALADCEAKPSDASNTHGRVSMGLAAMAARHAGEVAELQLQHTSALQELQGRADVSLGRARLAEVRCASLEEKQVRCFAMMAHQLEVQTCADAFVAWKNACRSARTLRQTKVCMASVLLRAFEQRESFPGMVLHSWAAVCLAERAQRRRNEMEAELSIRESVHQSRLSWLMSCRTSSELQAGAKVLFLSWRCVALSAGSSGLHVRLRLEEARRISAQRYLLQQRERHGSQFTVQDVLGAWSQEVLVRRHHKVLQQSNLARVQHAQVSKSLSLKWLALLQSSKEDALLSRAFLAMHLETRERVQEARSRALSAQQTSELVSCANSRAIQAVLLAMDRSGLSLQKSAFSEWRATVHAGKTTRSLEMHQRTAAVLQRRFECIVTGLSSRSVALRKLSQALLAWARAARQRALDNLRVDERAQFCAWRLRFIESSICWQGKDFDALLVFHTWQAWIQFCQLTARDHASAKFLGHVHQLQSQWSNMQILTIGASLQVQLSFLMRACFAAWRRARRLARASGDQQECQRLQIRLAQACYSRDCLLQSVAGKVQEQAVGFWLRLAWVLWCRLRLERMILEESDAARALLEQLQERWAQHQMLQHAQEQADHQACHRLEHMLEVSQDSLRQAANVSPAGMIAESGMVTGLTQRLPPPCLCHGSLV
ncbi:unnamed protein product [Symbiodinium natans]|uniref:Sfi1 spindle body domain-containing protein n=1 Tax=Symbiodinium natans TaxID=878477 RepID=A0A812Q2G1_9DINO|nr:unnamed protein product [Symbiodinium natans]